MSKKIQLVGALKTPQSDWNQTDETKLDYIKNKPDYEALIQRIEALELQIKELTTNN